MPSENDTRLSLPQTGKFNEFFKTDERKAVAARIGKSLRTVRRQAA